MIPESKKFNFWLIWFCSTIVLSAILGLFYWSIGSYDKGFSETFSVVVILSALLGVLVTFCVRWTKRNLDLSPEELCKYRGIGGSLILVGMGLFIVVAWRIFFAYVSYLPFYGVRGFRIFVNNQVPPQWYMSSEYFAFLKFEMIVQIILLIAILYLIYLFFRKDWRFPNFSLIYFAVLAVHGITIFSLRSFFALPGEPIKYIVDWVRIWISIVWYVPPVLIWYVYITKSKRVRATFLKN